MKIRSERSVPVRLTTAIFAAIGIGLAVWPTSSSAFFQDQKHYEKALLERSSSPYYILITIVDDNTGLSQEGCVMANFLLGAIHFQENIPYTEVTIREVIWRAIDNASHVFHFSNARALANVKLDYSQEEFKRAQSLIDQFGLEVVRYGKFEERKVLGDLAWSDALACAIIERGWMSMKADIGGEVFGEPYSDQLRFGERYKRTQ